MKYKSFWISLLSLSLLSSCSYLLTVKGRSQRLILQSSDDLNESRPLRVDVAMTTDEEVARQLSTMQAATYFSTRDQMVRDHPHQLMVASWEIVPGQRLEHRITAGAHDPFTGFVFAEYSVRGAHRAPLPENGDVAIMLHRSDLKVESL